MSNSFGEKILDGKVAFVAGGTRGFNLAIAQKYAETRMPRRGVQPQRRALLHRGPKHHRHGCRSHGYSLRCA